MSAKGHAAFLTETAVMPVQARPVRPLTPEQHLLLALLQSASDDLVGYKPSTLTYRNAAQWVRDGRLYPFSFTFCCDVLDLDASNLRGGLLGQATREGRPAKNRVRA